MIPKDFENKLEDYKKIINLTIINDLKARKPKSLYLPLLYFLKGGGKRLRGILLLLIVDAFSKDSPTKYLNQAVAIELLHNFTLIHDDIMDNSIKRHNQPTVHVKYDTNTAILSGDVLLAIAYDFLTRNLEKDKIKIVDEFTKALTVVCEGQAFDKEFELRNKVSINEYFEMISRKTGALIESTCKIGARLSSLNEKFINRLGQFGLHLGIAFQLQDDLLDLVGETHKFGKQKGIDLVEGKKTFIILKALKKAKGKDLNKIKKLIDNKGIKLNQIDNFIALLERLDVFNDVRKEIDKHYEIAVSNLKSLPNKYKLLDLYHFADKVLHREY